MSDAITDMWRSEIKETEYPTPELQELAKRYCEKNGITYDHLITLDWLSIAGSIFKIKNMDVNI